jgi:hypothetical protein
MCQLRCHLTCLCLVQLRIDVLNADSDSNVTVHAFVLGTPFTAAVPNVGYPIVLSARGRNAYFVEPEAFNPLTMFQSPMMLMMLVTGVMLFATPYLMVCVKSFARHSATANFRVDV